MRKERQIALVERLLGAVDVDRYVSPSRLEAERRMLFRQRPIIVGRTSDLAAGGSFFTHDASGVPILMTRDNGGRVHAMLNVCRHRGTRLVYERSGTGATTFVCVLHAWTYDLCGNLGTMPLSRCLPTAPREDGALVELPCDARDGFLWVIPRAARRGETFTAPPSGRDLEEHVVVGRSESIGKANWKLVVDAMNMAKDEESIELLFPSSALVIRPDAVTHVALFPKAIDEVLVVQTLLAPPGGGAREMSELPYLAIAEKVQSMLHPDAQRDAPDDPIRAFHDAIDEAIGILPP